MVFFHFFLDCKNRTMSSQGSVGGAGSPKFKIDKGSPLWRHTTRITQCPGGGAYIWKCNFCKVQYRSSYSRVRLHLLGPAGEGINMCEGSGPDKKGLSAAQIAALAKEQEDADRAVAKTKHAASKRTNTQPPPSNQPTTRTHPFLPMPTTNDEDVDPSQLTRKRGPLDRAFQNELRDIADHKIGRCLIANGVSFNFVRSPYFREMVDAINEAPNGYKPPGYEKLRTTILHDERKSVEVELQPIRDSWAQSGVSIVSDGWKDCRNRPLINVIAVCPKGAMFLKAVDCEGQVKDSKFISHILIDAIEPVGPDNVVQVVTDNAKVCRAAGIIIESRYDHIFWTPCTVHSLNLVMKSIGTEIDFVKNVYEEAEEIQMFVTNHHMSQAIFRSFSDLELLKVIFKFVNLIFNYILMNSIIFLCCLH